MQLIPITKDTFPLAVKFIEPQEEKCIFLASQIRRESENLYFLSKGTDPSVALSHFSEILGIISVDSTIFHCFTTPEAINLEELKQQLLPVIKEHNVKCISGEAKGTDLLIKALNGSLREPYQTNHYKLMTCGAPNNPPEELCNDDQILRCTQDDMELLFPIQKKYLSEEVAPFGKTVSDAEVSIGLRQILKNQLVLALQSDGEIVAKANTNAIGINWIQLGGIYTHPLYRRNGYAWQLISAICRRTYKAGKKTALFVKDINVPAMELYKQLGFTNSGLYEICYY